MELKVCEKDFEKLIWEWDGERLIWEWDGERLIWEWDGERLIWEWDGERLIWEWDDILNSYLNSNQTNQRLELKFDEKDFEKLWNEN